MSDEDLYDPEEEEEPVEEEPDGEFPDDFNDGE